MAQIFLAEYYLSYGDFEEAEKSFNRNSEAYRKYNNLWQMGPLGYLSDLALIKGDVQNAKELNVQRLDVAKRFNSTYGIFGSLTRKGFQLYQEGNYDESIKAHRESIVNRKQYGDPLQMFWGYFTIFNFFYQRFKVTKDRTFLSQAEKTFSKLQELNKTHPDNKSMINYTNYAQALILKFGNIRKKGKAIDIIEELVEAYPNNIGISLDLAELLFEDVLLTEDPDTIDQIEKFMKKLNQIPLSKNPQAIISFTSQQIFLAKYIYYIKGDISEALNILHNAIDHVKSFKLNNLVKTLDTEIQKLENDIKKWENVDMSIKERIKASEFNEYIQQALETANK